MFYWDWWAFRRHEAGRRSERDERILQAFRSPRYFKCGPWTWVAVIRTK